MSAPREGRLPWYLGMRQDVDSSKGAEGCTASVGQQHVSHAGMSLNDLLVSKLVAVSPSWKCQDEAEGRGCVVSARDITN